LLKFQADEKLPQTGQPDEATLARLGITSQESANDQQHHPQAHQTDDYGYRYETLQGGAVIKEPLPGFAAYARRQAHRWGEFIEKHDKGITALSTVVIALFTAALAIFMVSLAFSTRKAARAAKDAADALPSVEPGARASERSVTGP
jgi:hypothetical protein